jgi:hypothetical protein
MLPLLEADRVWYAVLASIVMQATRPGHMHQRMVARSSRTPLSQCAKASPRQHTLQRGCSGKHCNGCVFDNNQPSTHRLNDSIGTEAAMWARAGANGLRVILPTTWDVHWISIPKLEISLLGGL